MRHLLWTALGLTTLLAGCDSNSSVQVTSSKTDTEGGPLKVVESLQCPQTEGVLTRQGSANADGRACTYVGPRGAEVQLEMVMLEGTSSRDYLSALETEMSALLPHAIRSLEADKARAQADRARAQADTARAQADAAQAKHDQAAASADQARALDEAEAQDEESAHVRLPGMTVDAVGDKASIRLPGMRIEADGDRSVVRIGGIVIHSDTSNDTKTVTIPGEEPNAPNTVNVESTGDATRIRARLPGQAVRASYRLSTNSHGPDTWRVVGYEARGPEGGPIIVARVRSRADNDDRVFDAAKDLVTRNVGN